MPKPIPGQKSATALKKLHKEIKANRQERRDRRDPLPGLPPHNIENVVPNERNSSVLQHPNGKPVRVPNLIKRTLEPLITHEENEKKTFQRRSTKDKQRRPNALRM